MVAPWGVDGHSITRAAGLIARVGARTLGSLIDAGVRLSPNDRMMLRTSFRSGLFLSSALPLGALFLAVSGAGCAETIREYDTGSGGSGSSSSSSGAGGVGGVGGGDVGGAGGSGGVGGAPPLECMPGQPFYAGPLCGDPSMPCKLFNDEMLQSPPSFRNDAPAVAADPNCEPQIMYSTAEGGFKGFYAKRGPGNAQFVEEQTPFPFAFGGLAVGSDGAAFALAYGGAFNVTMYRYGEGGWDAGSPLPGENLAYPRGLARSENGTLHVGARAKDDTVLYALFDPVASSWSAAPLGSSGTAQVALAVTPAGTPHLAYWDSIPGGGGWALFWATPGFAPEIAAPLNGNTLESASQLHSIAVAPDASSQDGAPHILMVRNVAGGNTQEIVVVLRNGGSWLITAIDQEKVANVKLCNFIPMNTGELCDFDYEEIFPIGIVASQGGEVLALYNKVNRIGTMVANCNDPMFCYWMPQSDNSTGQINVAKFKDGALTAQGSVAVSTIIQSGAAALDTIGRVHIALYDRLPNQGSTVRYLLLGP